MAFHRVRLAPLALALCACIEARAAESLKSVAADASALLKRANYYRSAMSKEQDPALAFRWMQEAAQKGLPAAQYELAKMLLAARGAPFDLEKAREWLQRASVKDKRAAALLAKISERPPQAPPTIPRRAPPLSQLALSPDATARNGTAGVADAAARGDLPALQALLRAGASIETMDADGRTPLMATALEGRADAAKLLIERGADPDAQDRRGETPLILAARNRRLDAAALLLATGKIKQASLNSALFLAAGNCDAAMLMRLREKGARALSQKDGETPLMRAAAACSAGVVNLLSQAEPIDAVDHAGRTALWIAARHGDSWVVAALLARGASPEAADRFGYTPLLAALEQGKEEAALTLMRAGANVSARTETGKTPLILSAHRGLKRFVGEALARKADPNLRDALGMTALMAAAERGHDEIVGALLANGADRNLRNKKRETAIELAGDEKTRGRLLN
jgi:ankyrin repeat protein